MNPVVAQEKPDMKRLLIGWIAVLGFAFLTGCQQHAMTPNGCPQCGNGHFANGPRGYDHVPRAPFPNHHPRDGEIGPPGPETAQYAYPYYTVRGPRDFLLDNPPTIGR
jgi:hypothetical protein